MKTCSKCGCYIPDNWDSCPACKRTIKVNTTTHTRYIDKDSLLFRTSDEAKIFRDIVNYEYSTVIEWIETYYRKETLK